MCRMNVEFGPDQAEALERLAHATGMTKVGVIRSSVALMQIAMREARRGNGIGIVQGGKVVSELAGVWNQAMAELCQ